MPETIVADKDIDTRADIYALGCVAYWMLTGQALFAGDLMSVLIQHVEK